jgi:hypothetical protein
MTYGYSTVEQTFWLQMSAELSSNAFVVVEQQLFQFHPCLHTGITLCVFWFFEKRYA